MKYEDEQTLKMCVSINKKKVKFLHKGERKEEMKTKFIYSMVNRSTWYQVPPTISTILCSVMLIFSIATFLDTTVKVWSKLRMLVWQNI